MEKLGKADRPPIWVQKLFRAIESCFPQNKGEFSTGFSTGQIFGYWEWGMGHWAEEHWAEEHWAEEHWAEEHWAEEHWALGRRALGIGHWELGIGPKSIGSR